MFKLNQRILPQNFRTIWAWVAPLVVVAPLAFAASGCNNSGVIGDDCPTTAECASGGSGGSSTGSVIPVGAGKTCGGLLGTTCSKGLYCDFPSSAACGDGDQTGVCRSAPEACDAIYAPVCGCDSKTYGSDCAANSAGVSVASTGKCDSGAGGSGNTGGTGSGGASGSPGSGGTAGSKTCGGLAGGEKCATDQYCLFPAAAACGAADQTGTCTDKPQACDLIYAPVCGCDGVTYGNDCAAASAGVSVATTGECVDGGATCGGRGGGTCATNEYCKYEPAAMCGRADATGTCTKLVKDAGCLAVYDPVCGCDGVTYGNDCEAARAGASVDHGGECVCGGLRGLQCTNEEYFCDYPAAMACGRTDGQGSCTKKPSACTKELNPVCGCDGKPYDNACDANAHGTSVANQGACK